MGAVGLLKDPRKLEQLATRPLPWASPEEPSAKDLARLRRVLDRLPPKDRELLDLVYLQGRSQRDVAAELGVRQQSVQEGVQNALGRAVQLAKVVPWTQEQVRDLALAVGSSKRDAEIVAAWWATPNVAVVAEKFGCSAQSVCKARDRFVKLAEEAREQGLRAALALQGVARLRKVKFVAKG